MCVLIKKRRETQKKKRKKSRPIMNTFSRRECGNIKKGKRKQKAVFDGLIYRYNYNSVLFTTHTMSFERLKDVRLMFSKK